MRTNPTVYHGTPNSFSQFEVGKTATNHWALGKYETRRSGIFFTDDKAFAQTFAKQDGFVIAVQLDIQKPIDLTEGYPGDFFERHRDMLEQHNIAIFNMSPLSMWELFDEGFPGGPQFTAALKQDGYDGAVLTERDRQGDTHTSYVVFSPAQIHVLSEHEAEPQTLHRPPRG